MNSKIEIVPNSGNLNPLIPPHWDLHREEDIDPIVTVWISLEIAEKVARFLEDQVLESEQ